jgi:hypothetical protein
MNVCKNCQSTISCGCQIRRASDGTDCCSKCLIEVEARIGNTIPFQQETQNNEPRSTDPTNIKVSYTQNLRDL